jgi:hypothetical protein
VTDWELLAKWAFDCKRKYYKKGMVFERSEMRLRGVDDALVVGGLVYPRKLLSFEVMCGPKGVGFGKITDPT